MQLLLGRTIGVGSLAVSPDSRYVAAGGGMCHLWDLTAAKLMARTPDGPGVHASRMAFPAPGVLMSQNANQLRRHDLDAGTHVVYSSPRVDGFLYALLHPSGDSLKAIERGGRRIVTFTLTDSGLGAFESEWLPTAPVPIAFAPDGTRYLAIQMDSDETHPLFHLRDTATDEVVAAFAESESMESPDYHPTLLWLFAPGGRRLFAAVNRRYVAYDCASGGLSVAQYLATSVGRVCAMAAHPDGRRVATVEDHRTVTLRDADSFAPLRCYDFAMPKVTCVAFTPDGTRCVIGNSRGKVLLFDLE